jgi:hypothetical protein
MPVTFLKPKDKEHGLVQHLLKYFDWEINACFPNTHLFDWESDLLVVSKNGYLTEVEVKNGLADWKADLGKDKFNKLNQKLDFERYIKRFYYAVPAQLYKRYLEDPFPIVPTAGILVAGGWHRTDIAEERPAASNASALSITAAQQTRLYRSAYYRFSRQYLRGIQTGVRKSTKER